MNKYLLFVKPLFPIVVGIGLLGICFGYIRPDSALVAVAAGLFISYGLIGFAKRVDEFADKPDSPYSTPDGKPDWKQATDGFGK